MSDSSSAATVPAGQLLSPLDRQVSTSRKAIISVVFSIALIIAVFYRGGGLEFEKIWRIVPGSLLFWTTFAVYYIFGPACEWLIFRKLWRIPATGILPLLRKKIYNELLLGYLGEAYFYMWARKRVAFTAAPFGAVKDVAILSAVAGNGVTLALLLVMLPVVGLGGLGIDAHTLTVSLSVILAISIAALVWQRKVFSLPRSELAMILRNHVGRIVGIMTLWAIMWHMVLPQVSASWLLYLVTLRMLVTRLPLVPSKDLLFAGLALIALGHEQYIGELMTMIAGITMIAHLVLGAGFALWDLAFPEVEL